MRALRFVLLAASTASAIAATPQAETFDLVWRPKASDTLAYRLAIEIKVQDFRFNFDTDLKMRVTKVEENGDYEVETATQNMKVLFNGQEEFVPDDEKPTSAKFNAKGERLGDSTSDPEDKEADPVSRLLNDISNFSPPEAPVRKGEKWSKVQKADKEKGVGGAVLDYEVKDVDKDRVSLKYTFRQTDVPTPAHGGGTITLRREDYSLSDVDIEVDDFKMDDDAPVGHAHLKLKRS